MSHNLTIRPADEGIPTPDAVGFERVEYTCMTCGDPLTIWKWADAPVTATHTLVAGSPPATPRHTIRHGKRGTP